MTTHTLSRSNPLLTAKIGATALLALLVVALLFAVEETRTSQAANVSSQVNLQGFEIELTPETKSEVVVGSIPSIFESSPAAIAVPTSDSLEGQVADPSRVCSGAPLIIRNVSSRPLGTWLAYVIEEDGGCIATRQGFPREGPGLPSYLALETALTSWAGTATVRGPTEPFDRDGIRFFPPEQVRVRGAEGIYLKQEGEGTANAVPAHHLVWIEDGAYWHLIGMDEAATGDDSFYNLDRLLLVADSLVEGSPVHPVEGPPELPATGTGGMMRDRAWPFFVLAGVALSLCFVGLLLRRMEG